MEFSCADAVTDKIGRWEEEKEDKHLIGARFGCLHVDLCRSRNFATTKGHGKLHFQMTTRLQRLSRRLGTSSVGLTFGYNRAPRKLYYEVPAP